MTPQLSIAACLTLDPATIDETLATIFGCRLLSKTGCEPRRQARLTQRH